MSACPTRRQLNGEAFADRAQWEAWVADHHESTTGVWLKIAKRGSGKTSVTITVALDVALCYGWIDSQRKTYDREYYLQRYSPRRPNSPWSRINVEKVEALVDAAYPGPGVIYFSRLEQRATQSRLSRLSRLASLPVYQYMTARNWNTTTKLLALMDVRAL